MKHILKYAFLTMLSNGVIDSKKKKNQSENASLMHTQFVNIKMKAFTKKITALCIKQKPD